MKWKKCTVLTALLLDLILFVAGCGSTKSEDFSANEYIFTDDLGYEVKLKQPQKVAVCSGSLAEIWLLAGGELCAVTQDAYDDHLYEVPEETVNIGKMKSPSVEQMITLGVDFVVLSSEIAEHTALRGTLEKAGINAAYFHVNNFDEYLSLLELFTEITGRTDLYESNGAAVKSRIDEVIGLAYGKAAPTVLYLRCSSVAVHAKDSTSLAGSMLKDLGCINIADTGSLINDLSLEVIVKSDPDFIFVTFMGSDENKAMQVLEETLLKNPAWSELSAVKNNRFVILQKSLYHYKPNAKWGEAYQQLWNILYA